MKLKLCGIRRAQDVDMINKVSPDFIGYIFYEKSRRYISPENAKKLNEMLNEGISPVGVFVNKSVEETAEIANGLSLKAVQLHGDEDESYIRRLRELYGGEIWKAVRVQGLEDIQKCVGYSADMLLLDAFTPNYGGSGKRIDLSFVKKADLKRPFFLAGGINAQNLGEILSEISPCGIDVSSGFETEGIKDENKLMEFINIFNTERRKYNE